MEPVYLDYTLRRTYGSAAQFAFSAEEVFRSDANKDRERSAHAKLLAYLRGFSVPLLGLFVEGASPDYANQPDHEFADFWKEVCSDLRAALTKDRPATWVALKTTITGILARSRCPNSICGGNPVVDFEGRAALADDMNRILSAIPISCAELPDIDVAIDALIAALD